MKTWAFCAALAVTTFAGGAVAAAATRGHEAGAGQPVSKLPTGQEKIYNYNGHPLHCVWFQQPDPAAFAPWDLPELSCDWVRYHSDEAGGWK